MNMTNHINTYAHTQQQAIRTHDTYLHTYVHTTYTTTSTSRLHESGTNMGGRVRCGDILSCVSS